MGEADSCFVILSLCFRPSAHPQALIVPHLFCFRNIRYARASLRCSVVRSLEYFGFITVGLCSCPISDFTAWLPASPNKRNLVFIGTCAVDWLTSPVVPVVACVSPHSCDMPVSSDDCMYGPYSVTSYTHQ